MAAPQDSTRQLCSGSVDLHHCLHLGAELPIGQRLTQGWHLFHDVQQGGLVKRLLHAVPRQGVHQGADLPSGQRLTQGWRLLHELLRHADLVRLLHHVGPLHDLSLLLLLDINE